VAKEHNETYLSQVNAVDDGGDVLEALEPLSSLTSLTSDIYQNKRYALVLEACLDNTCRTRETEVAVSLCAGLGMQEHGDATDSAEESRKKRGKTRV
jgi:hypothetical protein